MNTLKGWLSIVITGLLAVLFFYLNTKVDADTLSFKLNCVYGSFWSVLSFYFISAEEKNMKTHHGLEYHKRAWVNFVLLVYAPFRMINKFIKRFRITR